MHPLFHDLLYPCVTGCLDLSNKPALQIFIRSNIRQTCTWINQKVDELTKEAFKNIYPGLGDVSIRFICKWILGKPTINKLEELPLQDFSLELLVEKISSLTPVYCNTGPANLLALSGPELCLIDLKNWLYNKQEIFPIFTKTIQPIFYNDQQLIAFNNKGEIELHCHPSKTIHELPTILNSMQRLDDHIVIESMDRVISISIENLISSDDLKIHVHEELEGAEFVKAFSSELLFFNKQIPAFYMLYAENKKLKVNECPVKGTDLANLFHNHHVFHEQSKYTIFLFQQLFRGSRIGAISPDELTPSEPQTFIFHDNPPIPIEGMLIPYKDTVLLCNVVEHHLQIERVDIVNEIIHMEPLKIKGGEALRLNHIISAFYHLDKLFIIANSRKGYYWEDTHQHLIVVDMTNHILESAKELGASLYIKTGFISSTLGKVHVTFPKDNNLEIFKVDYT